MKDAPEATSTHDQAKEKLQKLLDSFHATAHVEFIGERDVLKQFDQAKKLRYTPDPRSPKQPPEAPAR